MGFYNVATIDFAGANTTVIWSLRGRIASLRPAIWPPFRAVKCIFLLKAEPWLLVGMCIHLASAVVAVIEFVGCAVVIPAFTHDKDIVAATERVWKDRYGPEVDIGIVTGGLAA